MARIPLPGEGRSDRRSEDPLLGPWKHPEELVPAMVRQGREATGGTLRLERPAAPEKVNDAAVGQLGTRIGPLLLSLHVTEHAPLLMHAGKVDQGPERSWQRGVSPGCHVVHEAHKCHSSRGQAGPSRGP